MKNIQKNIVEILVNKFGIEESQITVNDELANIGMDSIAIIELKLEILNKFSLKQEDINILEDDSVNELVNKINPFLENVEERKYA